MNSNPTETPPVDVAAAGPRVATAADAPAARKRRRRRWLIGLICLLGLLAIPVGGYFALAWQRDHELEAIIAELDRTDPHWRFDDMAAQRPPVADADNPALVVMKVDALMRPVGGVLSFQNEALFQDPLPPVHRLNGLQIAALREGLAKHGEALKLARTLKDFPGEGRHSIKVAPDWISTNLDPLQRTRGVMWMLDLNAKLRAEDDDATGAVESCRALLVAARSIGLEPYLIAALIRYAGQAMTVNALERTLAQTEPPAEQLEAMQELLAREIEAPILVEAMRGERAGDDQLMLHLKDGNVKISALMAGPIRGTRNSLEDWLMDHLPLVVSGGRPEFLRMMNKNVEAAKLPPEKQGPVFDEINREARDSSAIFVRLLLPATQKVSQAHRRIQAQMRCAMVGVAAERYRIKHGQWPAALADLCTDGLLAAVPTDPCDGRPLRYKGLPNGVLVYSVGMDGVDNGGALDRVNLIGTGVDIGFQLWDVPARRQAPLPVRQD